MHISAYMRVWEQKAQVQQKIIYHIKLTTYVQIAHILTNNIIVYFDIDKSRSNSIAIILLNYDKYYNTSI